MEKFGWIKAMPQLVPPSIPLPIWMSEDTGKDPCSTAAVRFQHTEILHMCSRDGGKWPGTASTKVLHLGFKPLAPLCSTNSLQCRRMVGQQKGLGIKFWYQKSRHKYILHHSSMAEVAHLSHLLGKNANKLSPKFLVLLLGELL